MDLLALIEALKAIPKLGEILALAKAMPALLEDTSAALLVVEKGLDDAATVVPGFDAAASKAALEKVRGILATVDSTLKSIVG